MAFFSFIKAIERIVIYTSFALTTVVGNKEVIAIKAINFTVNIHRINVQILRVILCAEHEEVCNLPKEGSKFVSLKFLI